MEATSRPTDEALFLLPLESPSVSSWQTRRLRTIARQSLKLETRTPPLKRSRDQFINYAGNFSTFIRRHTVESYYMLRLSDGTGISDDKRWNVVRYSLQKCSVFRQNLSFIHHSPPNINKQQSR